jgi:hypothetical protein
VKLMPSYPSEWTKNVVLKSGVEVFLRPELSDDTEMLWEMFSTLSKKSLEYLIHPFTRERIEGWTSNVDYSKHLPILALIQEMVKNELSAQRPYPFILKNLPNTRQRLL